MHRGRVLMSPWAPWTMHWGEPSHAWASVAHTLLLTDITERTLDYVLRPGRHESCAPETVSELHASFSTSSASAPQPFAHQRTRGTMDLHLPDLCWPRCTSECQRNAKPLLSKAGCRAAPVSARPGCRLQPAQPQHGPSRRDIRNLVPRHPASLIRGQHCWQTIG